MPFEDIPSDPSLIDPLPETPLELLARWLDEARADRTRLDPWAFCVSSADADGRSSSRMVMCRGYDSERGYIVFHTNRNSRKSREILERPFASAVFFSADLNRQARIEGPLDFLPDAESDAYFASRPRLSQIAAWASDQGEPIASRKAMLESLARTEQRFGETDPVPRPPHWGGYRIWLETVELRVGAEGRAHDRGEWKRSLRPGQDGFESSEWKVSRLQP